MSYIGQTLPTDVFGGYTTDTFAGDGSATTFTLSQAPFNEQGLIVVINNVIQQPTTNYTVSGTTLTIVGTAVASGDVIYARHTGVALPIGEANALDLQGQSDKLILDADADTTISADTDDQIDFKAGGTDIFQLTATTATINDGTTITTNDNSDTLTLVSTDADANVGPNLNLYRNSSSPADDDVLGLVIYNGQNDNNETIIYARQISYIKDASDGTEDGQLTFQTMVGGTIRDRLNINQDEIVLNEDSVDVDFRVESNGDANCLRVKGDTDKVGIGTNSPSHKLHVQGEFTGTSTGSAHFDNTHSTVVTGDEVVRISFSGDGDATGGHFINFFDSVGDIGRINVANSSTVSYVTSSDYRLKENVSYTWDATTRLKQLKPIRFNFIKDASDTPQDGFLAHEVSTVVPIAVDGTKDQVYLNEDGSNKLDDDGNTIPKHQGVDHSLLVPLMVKTIQELEARIKTLEDA